MATIGFGMQEVDKCEQSELRPGAWRWIDANLELGHFNTDIEVTGDLVTKPERITTTSIVEDQNRYNDLLQFCEGFRVCLGNISITGEIHLRPGTQFEYPPTSGKRFVFSINE